jgi:predicted CopG family antitoxin
MSSKTITVTESAYEALRANKEPKESFSEAILRITRRRSLNEFYGILKGEGGEKFEKVIMERRKEHMKTRQERIMRIKEEMKK